MEKKEGIIIKQTIFNHTRACYFPKEQLLYAWKGYNLARRVHNEHDKQLTIREYIKFIFLNEFTDEIKNKTI
jgi:hypothetical protein